MDSVSDSDLLHLLITDLEQWDTEFDTLDHEAITAAWAENIVAAQLPPEFTYAGQRWIDSPYSRGFLPIGWNAIRDNGRHRGLVQRDREALANAVAILPGDEYLYVPVSGIVNGTLCELLFLTERIDIQAGTNVAIATEPNGRPFHLSNSIRLEIWRWNPARVAYRITGYLDDPEVQQLMRNATTWWKRFGGGEDLAELKSRRGRKSIPLTYEMIAAVHREIAPDYKRQGSDARLEDIAEYLKSDPSLPTASVRTLERRIGKWIQGGKPWPP